MIDVAVYLFSVANKVLYASNESVSYAFDWRLSFCALENGIGSFFFSAFLLEL